MDESQGEKKKMVLPSYSLTREKEESHDDESPLTQEGSMEFHQNISPNNDNTVSFGKSASNGDVKFLTSRTLQRRFSFGDSPQHPPGDKEEDFLLGRASGRNAASWNVLVTEVVPSNCTLNVKIAEQSTPVDWRLPLSLFTSKKGTFQSAADGCNKRCQLSKRLRSYYEAQDRLISAYESMEKDHLEPVRVETDAKQLDQCYRQGLFYSRITLLVNFLLLVAKLVASILSGSMAVISSVVDSALDLVSGAILWWASRAVRSRSLYTYPQGRTKLEPVAIVILSVVMALASVQIIQESVEKIIHLVDDTASLPIVDVVTFCIMGGTILVKLVLFLVCRRIRSPIVRALALDHRNDVASNAVAIVCGYLGSANFELQTGLHHFSYVDPIGAILISLYIIYNWYRAGAEQIKMLTGLTARPDFLSQLTWAAVNHHPHVQQVDTVRAFHFGSNFLVEVDIVLPSEMPLREAHDIGESLQHRLESLPEVERAFVHLDFESTHHPHSEHKVV